MSSLSFIIFFFFFFQAEDGIRDSSVTGVQTCALPICISPVTQASLQGEIHQSERLAGQVGCRPAVTPDHPVGSDTSQGTVNVSVTCHAQVYDHEAVVPPLTNPPSQETPTTPGTGSPPHSSASTTRTHHIT